MKLTYQSDFVTRVQQCFPADTEVLKAVNNGLEDLGKILAKRLSEPPRNDMLTGVMKLDTETIRTVGDRYREGAQLLAEWIETYKPVGYKIPIFA